MNRKRIFIGYFLLMLVLYTLLAVSFPTVSTQEYLNLFFGYQKKPLIMTMLCTLSFFFDYLSLLLPKLELDSIRSFYVVRQAPLRLRLMTCAKFIAFYISLYILSKGYLLFFVEYPFVWLWLMLSFITWLVAFVITQNRKFILPNRFLLIYFVILRVMAYCLLN